LSQQIADLCGELDSCLGNLDEWQKQGSRRVENLKRELAKEFGTSYKEPDQLSHGAWLLQDVDDEGNASTAASVSAPQGDGTPASSMPGVQLPASSSAADAWEQADRHRLAVAAAAAHASQEQARLQKLRQEVESLRRKSEQQEWDQSAGLPETALEPSGGASAFNVLDGWGDEVDSMLGLRSQHESEIPDLTVGELNLEDLERRLNEAQSGVLEAEHALDSARARLAGQVGELDALMRECERLSDGMDLPADLSFGSGA